MEVVNLDIRVGAGKGFTNGSEGIIDHIVWALPRWARDRTRMIAKKKRGADTWVPWELLSEEFQGFYQALTLMNMLEPRL